MTCSGGLARVAHALPARDALEPVAADLAGFARSGSFAFAVSAANPACSQSFAPAAASDHVSSRPKRGERICETASPAAAQVPPQRLHVTSSPIAWR